MSWLSIPNHLPRPHDKDRLTVAWTRWEEKAERPRDEAFAALLESLFGNSPYLTEAALQNPSFLTDLWRDGPDTTIASLNAGLAATTAEARDGVGPAPVAFAPRRAQRRGALAVAVADIAGVWPLERITGALS